MQASDLLLCTFQGDTASPPTVYIAEIVSVDEDSGNLTCRLVDTDQEFTFDFASDPEGPWQGNDINGDSYIIETHEVYTGEAVSPSANNVAIITFSDNRRYLCYVDSISPALSVIFYHPGTPQISIEDDVVTASNWDAYPVGTAILAAEGAILTNSAGTAPVSDTSSSTDEIVRLAAGSSIAAYQWKNRGRAPLGFTKGMALVYGRVYSNFLNGDPAAVEMAKAESGNADKDALSWLSQEFSDAGLDNSTSGADTLRHLFVMLYGLGMRESSGKYCEGRDMSATNTTADTAEAGLFQTSFNIRSAHPTLPVLFSSYRQKTDFIDIFKEGASCSASDATNFGVGDGREYQELAKSCPAFAVEFTAVAARNRRKHWGPINKKTLEIRPEIDTMLLGVQDIIDLNWSNP